MSDETPEIQVDSDWKQEAQAEKDKLASQETPAADARKLPPADFKGLIGLLASQAIMGLGAMPDPSGRGVVIDMDGARFAIDLLVVIQEKTKGNLDAEEDSELETLIVELRARYVQVSELVAQQQAGGMNPEAGGPADSGIITP
ncbi:MAG: hypothetical protein CMJ24_10035 [Phycisphaerae bacterium]|nr:hypothetical protein [Phycisphaerae bacterium]|tara:strand:- start:2262 stop:2693 length:432 start_codon:yes stop_codon:yes gene_type:complete